MGVFIQILNMSGTELSMGQTFLNSSDEEDYDIFSINTLIRRKSVLRVNCMWKLLLQQCFVEILLAILDWIGNALIRWKNDI